MKKILILMMFMFSNITYAIENSDLDIIEFDHPFLLGDWKFPNDNLVNKSLTVSLESDYSYSIVTQDGSKVMLESGSYEYQSEKLKFIPVNGDSRQYKSKYNYKSLTLNGVNFEKIPILSILGSWKSREIYSESNKGANKFDIIFLDDFIFSMEVGTDEKLKKVIGIYTIEKDKILLISESGQVSAEFVFRDDMMIIDFEEGDFKVNLVKI